MKRIFDHNVGLFDSQLFSTEGKESLKEANTALSEPDPTDEEAKLIMARNLMAVVSTTKKKQEKP